MGVDGQTGGETQEKMIFRKLSEEFRRKLSSNTEEYEQIKAVQTQGSGEKSRSPPKKSEKDETFINKFVDINVASHCLKILILITQAFQRKFVQRNQQNEI